MKSVKFGAFIKAQREKKSIPQRKLAHIIDVDTSTLSKMEMGERQIPISAIKPWAEVLNIDYKTLQIKYITDKIKHDFKGEPFVKDALKEYLENE